MSKFVHFNVDIYRHIHFIKLGTSIELAHPTDVLKNIEAYNDIFNNIELSKKVAYALKAVYEYYKPRDVSI